MFSLPLEMPLVEMVKELAPYTAIPVCRYIRTVGTILSAFYNARDLFSADIKSITNPEEVKVVLRKPYFVPQTKSATKLFYNFRERKLSLAITVDEYGGVTGIVSMEDLLECIFGSLPRSFGRDLYRKYYQVE